MLYANTAHGVDTGVILNTRVLHMPCSQTTLLTPVNTSSVYPPVTKALTYLFLSARDELTASLVN